jgi:hypothetical protein
MDVLWNNETKCPDLEFRRREEAYQPKEHK